MLRAKLFAPTFRIGEDRITGQEMPTAVGEVQEKHLNGDHGKQINSADEMEVAREADASGRDNKMKASLAGETTLFGTKRDNTTRN